MALGIVVDDAIVVGEHSNYLRENRNLNYNDAPIVAATRMSAPVICAMLTTVGAFLPLFLIKGIIFESSSSSGNGNLLWGDNIGTPKDDIDAACKGLINGWTCLRSQGVDVRAEYNEPSMMDLLKNNVFGSVHETNAWFSGAFTHDFKGADGRHPEEKTYERV